MNMKIISSDTRVLPRTLTTSRVHMNKQLHIYNHFPLMIVSTLIISTKLYFDKISTGHMYPKLCRGYNTKIL